MYLALYRKYRPRTFEDVISQPHITTTLKNEVINGKTAHAYLFTGPRGTGKTTCSKILSMAVNCESPVDGNPCLICESCRGIEQGSNLDVVEIDAASNNGVDNIRQLRDEASYTPSQCKYRVYIIDETHMLSTGAFNALLKIMEEPPQHVKFILATTEAHKVPATILSRCQRFDFRRIRPEDIRDRLLEIAEKEPFTLTADAAELIARLADGGMRDAFSLVDQCAAFADDITLDTVAQAAGVVGREYLYELTDCILRQDAGGAVSIIDRLYSMSKDMQGLLEEMINHLRNLMLVLTLRETKDLVNVLPGEMEHLQGYAKQLPLTAVLASISDLQECLDKMSRSFDKRLTLELCFVKLCTPAMGQTPAEIIARIDRLELALRKRETVENGAAAGKTSSQAGNVSPSPKLPMPSSVAKGEASVKPPLTLEKPERTIPPPVAAPPLPEVPEVVPPEELLPWESSSPEGRKEPIMTEDTDLLEDQVSLFALPAMERPPAPSVSAHLEELPPVVEAPIEKPESAPPDVAQSISRLPELSPSESSGVELFPQGLSDDLPEPVELESFQMEPTSMEITPLAEWADALLELGKSDPPLYGVLRDSRGFTQGDILYVDSDLSITATMMRQEGSAAKLVAAVENKTGRRYKIRVKAPQSKPEQKADPLAELLRQARAAGVEVREE